MLFKTLRDLEPALGFSVVIDNVPPLHPASNKPPVKFADSNVVLCVLLISSLPVVPPLKSYWYVQALLVIDVSVNSTLRLSNEPVNVNSLTFALKFGCGIDGDIPIKFFFVWYIKMSCNCIS